MAGVYLNYIKKMKSKYRIGNISTQHHYGLAYFRSIGVTHSRNLNFYGFLVVALVKLDQSGHLIGRATYFLFNQNVSFDAR